MAEVATLPLDAPPLGGEPSAAGWFGEPPLPLASAPAEEGGEEAGEGAGEREDGGAAPPLGDLSLPGSPPPPPELPWPELVELEDSQPALPPAEPAGGAPREAGGAEPRPAAPEVRARLPTIPCAAPAPFIV